MLLRILKSNQPINLILFPLIAVLFWVRNLMSPGEFDFSMYEADTVLFKPVYAFLSSYPILQEILALLLLITLGFFVHRLNNRYSFYRSRTMLPPGLLVILISGIAPIHFLHPVYPAALFLILSIDKSMGSFDSKQALPHCFDSGLLLGISTLFYFNLIYILPVSLLSLRILNREYSWRNLTVHFIGFLIPWIFAFSVYFIIDKIPDLLVSLNQNLFVNHFELPKNVFLLIYAGIWGFILFISGLALIRRFDEQKISTRKYHSILLLLAFTFFIIAVFSPTASSEILVLMAIPSAFIISYFLINIKHNFWAGLIFFILLILAIYIQISDLLPLKIGFLERILY
jgi:hypothetical protein